MLPLEVFDGKYLVGIFFIFLILSVLFNPTYEDKLEHGESIKRASVLKGLRR
jgi:hypothetical protein